MPIQQNPISPTLLNRGFGAGELSVREGLLTNWGERFANQMSEATAVMASQSQVDLLGRFNRLNENGFLNQPEQSYDYARKFTEGVQTRVVLNILSPDTVARDLGMLKSEAEYNQGTMTRGSEYTDPDIVFKVNRIMGEAFLRCSEAFSNNQMPYEAVGVNGFKGLLESQLSDLEANLRTYLSNKAVSPDRISQLTGRLKFVGIAAATYSQLDTKWDGQERSGIPRQTERLGQKTIARETFQGEEAKFRETTSQAIKYTLGVWNSAVLQTKQSINLNAQQAKDLSLLCGTVFSDNDRLFKIENATPQERKMMTSVDRLADFIVDGGSVVNEP